MASILGLLQEVEGEEDHQIPVEEEVVEEVEEAWFCE